MTELDIPYSYIKGYVTRLQKGETIERALDEIEDEIIDDEMLDDEPYYESEPEDEIVDDEIMQEDELLEDEEVLEEEIPPKTVHETPTSPSPVASAILKSFANKPKRSSISSTPKLQTDDDSDEEIERWVDRDADLPEDLEDFCRILMAAIYANDEEVDQEKMLRRTPLPELARYLKGQYWYKVHNNEIDENAVDQV